MSVRQKRGYLVLVTVVGLFVGLLAVVGVSQFSEKPASAVSSAKHTICHRTSATTNPYRKITVSARAIFKQDLDEFTAVNSKHPNAHNGARAGLTLTYDANGNTTNNVFDPIFNYPANDKRWGDIIPPYTEDEPLKSDDDSLNWGQTGQDIYNGVGSFSGLCDTMTALEFLTNVCGASDQACLNSALADLDDQGASEDVALRESLGGSFASALQNKTLAEITTSVGAATPQVSTDSAPCSLTPNGAGSWIAVFGGTGFTADEPLFTFFQYGPNTPLSDPELTAASSWDLVNVDQSPANNASMSTVSKVGVSLFDSGTSPNPVAIDSVQVAISGSVYVRAVMVTEVQDPDDNTAYIGEWLYGSTVLCDVANPPVSRSLTTTR
ncbi:MAG: hypothetical protein RL547_457, partial [Actinomycetota bacterium]